jgi:deoxyribodipyrimidine photo-lyase
MLPPPRFDTGLVWLRRDLRVDDHAALHHALSECRRVLCLFVFDRTILDPLPDRADRRVEFIRDSLQAMQERLQPMGGGLLVAHGEARQVIPAVAAALGAQAVYVARDYEPDAIRRDQAVAARLQADGRELLGCKDQVVFDTDEVMTGAGRPFSVFTPYRNAWLRRLGDGVAALAPFSIAGALATRLDRPTPAEAVALRDAGLLATGGDAVPALEAIGFQRTNLRELGIVPGEEGAARLLEDFLDRIGRYRDARDFPAVKGPSYLSVHLRFGTVSIRQLARHALQVAAAEPDSAEGAQTWLSELIWREFYFQVLFHHPHVVTGAFKPAYDAVRWETGPQADAHFEAWCEGRTGYPLVDAAMLQLNRTGYMHNRLRMVTASFLTKDLGIDWRRGERYFAERLIDFDLAANNGGWQWAASTGCDAQPYFRIFNPVSQSERFDAQGRFIKRYLPQLEPLGPSQVHAPWTVSASEQARLGLQVGRDYPSPVVDHAIARKATLERYGAAREPGVALEPVAPQAEP